MKRYQPQTSLVPRNAFRGAAIALALVLLANTAPAEEAKEDKVIRWRDGFWRTELSGFTGIRSGRRSRTGDFNLNGTLEYEMPAGKRSTTGIRVHPLFVYNEDFTDKTIWGVAVGPTIRIYRKDHNRHGVFGELDGSLLWQSNEIRGNTARINFLIETGVGYKFDSDWHVSAKLRHISNGGTAAENSGANGIGLALGYTF